MDTFDGNLDHFNPNKPTAGDETLPVSFYVGTQEDQIASAEQGRPIYKDVDCIRIYGGRNNIIDRPMDDMDKRRFARQYHQWKLTGEGNPENSGTPLTQWPLLKRSQVEEFKYFHIYTVEQLAAMPDSDGQRVMGFQTLKAKAKAYLEAAKGDAPLQKMQETIEGQKVEISRLTGLLQTLGAKFEKMANKAGIELED